MENWIQEIMLKLPFVEWDRSINYGDYLEVYGWIARKDNSRDFVLLEFDIKNREGYCLANSSAKYSKIISEILGEEHIDCEKINMHN